VRSVLVLIGFPLLLLGSVWAVVFLLDTEAGVDTVNRRFVGAVPFVLAGVAVWFLISFFAHTSIIKSITGSRTLERKENKRVYNLVENLCISQGMKMPKVNIIKDDALNAFASGINEKSYTVTLTEGLIKKLDDEELEGVIAHELMHIKNRDVRLMIISLVFVGIFAVVAQIAMRSMLYSSMSRRRNRDGGKVMIIIMVVAFVAYLLSLVFRFALSRKREYMADAGAAEMTRRPRALASALRKISGNHKVKTVKSDDVAEMFIENQPEKNQGILSVISGLFATHPPVEKRITVLEQF
jgi:heat shock protein HtpX